MMHYSKTAFQKGTEPTIVTKIPAFSDVIGQRMEFSDSDLLKLNRLYNCSKAVFGAVTVLNTGFWNLWWTLAEGSYASLEFSIFKDFFFLGNNKHVGHDWKKMKYAHTSMGFD